MVDNFIFIILSENVVFTLQTMMFCCETQNIFYNSLRILIVNFTFMVGQYLCIFF